MSKTKTSKLFRNGRSQAVRLPQEFRFEGDEVQIRRFGNGVLLEPETTDVQQWFADLDRTKSAFMGPKARQQPVTPEHEIFD